MFGVLFGLNAEESERYRSWQGAAVSTARW